MARGVIVDRRFIGGVLAICLPVVALAAGLAFYIIKELPKLTSRERAAVTRDCKALAVELVKRPDGAEIVGRRKKGWRRSGEIAGVRWGHAVVDGRHFVWCGNGETVFGTYGDAAVEGDPRMIFLWITLGPLTLAVLLTGYGLVFFYRFAKARDDFLAATAHDLTTPLAGLRLAIGRDEAEARKLVERMTRLVTNLKDFLRLNGQRPKPRMSTFDLVAAYREAYALYRDSYRDLFDDADIAVEGATALLVRADETWTLQILWNLLGNDLKYAAPYGAVRVRFERRDAWAYLSFIDEGPGMSSRQMRHAFDRYYRARTIRVSGKGGFGIGLCTSREMARAMGGDLTVRANTPHGCVFTLNVPCARNPTASPCAFSENMV